MQKQSITKSPRKVYAAIVGISVAVVFTVGLLSTWAAYPTSAHRDTAREQQQIINTQGDGAFNIDALGSKEYTTLANSKEATYSSWAYGIASFIQFFVYCSLLGLVYNYLRRKNVSPTRRALGATTFLVVLGSQIASILLLFPTHWFTAQPMSWGIWTIPLYALSFVVSLGLSFIVVWLFEWGYNKRHSFIVD